MRPHANRLEDAYLERLVAGGDVDLVAELLGESSFKNPLGTGRITLHPFLGDLPFQDVPIGVVLGLGLFVLFALRTYVQVTQLPLTS